MERQMMLQSVVRMKCFGTFLTRERVFAVNLLMLQQFVLQESFVTQFLVCRACLHYCGFNCLYILRPHLSVESLSADCAVEYFAVLVPGRVPKQVVQAGEGFSALVTSVRLQTLVLSDVGLVVGGPGEAVAADLANERLNRQVDLCVLAQVGLGCEPGAALPAHMGFRLIERGIPAVSRLG